MTERDDWPELLDELAALDEERAAAWAVVEAAVDRLADVVERRTRLGKRVDAAVFGWPPP